MITTLGGKNQFMLSQELNLIVDTFEKIAGKENIERFDALETNFDELVQATHAATLFSTDKLVIIREISGLDADNINRLITDVPQGIDIVFVDHNFDKRSGVFKILKQKTNLKEFLVLEAQKLPIWLVDLAKKIKVDLTIQDARFLIDRVGTNQAILYQELLKLASFDKHVTKKSIEDLIVASPQSTIFQLLEAAFDGQTKKALKFYDDQRDQGTEPAQILGMIIWQVHLMAIALWRVDHSAQSVASDFKANPYVIQKAINSTKRLTKTKFKRLVQEIYDVDLQIKTTKIDNDEVLKNLIMQICQT